MVFGPWLMSTNSKSELSHINSLNQQQIVVYDPPNEQFSTTRYLLAASILISTIVANVWLLYRRGQIGDSKYSQALPFAKSKLMSLLILIFTTNIFWGIHWIDNIMRPVDYYTPYWIHAGIFYCQDITAIAYNIYLLFTIIALNAIIQNKQEYKLMCYIMLNLYAFNIWFGIAHFIVEPISSFSIDCTLSIFGEVTFGMICHIYVLCNYNTLTKETNKQYNRKSPKAQSEQENLIRKTPIPTAGDFTRQRSH